MKKGKKTMFPSGIVDFTFFEPVGVFPVFFFLGPNTHVGYKSGNRLAQLDFTFRPIPPGSTVSLCVKMLHIIFFLKIGKNDVTRHG